MEIFSVNHFPKHAFYSRPCSLSLLFLSALSQLSFSAAPDPNTTRRLMRSVSSRAVRWNSRTLPRSKPTRTGLRSKPPQIRILWEPVCDHWCSLSPSPSAPNDWLRHGVFSCDPPPPAERDAGARQAWGHWAVGRFVVGFLVQWVVDWCGGRLWWVEVIHGLWVFKHQWCGFLLWWFVAICWILLLRFVGFSTPVMWVFVVVVVAICG